MHGLFYTIPCKGYQDSQPAGPASGECAIWDGRCQELKIRSVLQGQEVGVED